VESNGIIVSPVTAIAPCFILAERSRDTYTEPARDRKSFSVHLGSDASLIRVADTRPDSDALSRTSILANPSSIARTAGHRPTSRSASCKLARVDIRRRSRRAVNTRRVGVGAAVAQVAALFARPMMNYHSSVNLSDGRYKRVATTSRCQPRNKRRCARIPVERAPTRNRGLNRE